MLGDLSFAFFYCDSVEFVDVLLLIVGFESLDDFLDDSFLVVGMYSGEDDAGGPSHLKVLHILGLLLCEGDAEKCEE